MCLHLVCGQLWVQSSSPATFFVEIGHEIYWSKVLTDQQGLCRFFRKHKNSKISENSDNKTGDYSSFKFTKMFFQKKSLCIFLVKKMESTLPKYAPSISQLLIIRCIGHSRSHFLPLVLNGKKHWFAISEFFLCCDLSVIMFSSKGKGFRFPPV